LGPSAMETKTGICQPILTILHSDWKPFRLKIGTLSMETTTGIQKTILTTLNPDWKPFRLKIGTLCNGDCYSYT